MKLEDFEQKIDPYGEVFYMQKNENVIKIITQIERDTFRWLSQKMILKETVLEGVQFIGLSKDPDEAARLFK